MPGKMINQKDALQFMGIPEMRKQFESLTGSLQRKVLRQATNAGGTALIRAIRKATPKGPTGNLKRALKKKPSSKWRNSRAASAAGIIGVTIGHEWTIGPHSWLVNYGHEGIFWGNRTGERVPGTYYFTKAVKNARSEVRAKITAKAKQALPKAIVKQMTK
tara:strand:- start:219 stop:701 length:483 start_codon:yes stop_codon:yes gene_type:complete